MTEVRMCYKCEVRPRASNAYCWKCNKVYKKEYARKNPEKIMAHMMVKAAKMSGTLVRQPCETCGSTFVQAHHDDYSKPLEVRWLCSEHHNALHRAQKETAPSPKT